MSEPIDITKKRADKAAKQAMADAVTPIIAPQGFSVDGGLTAEGMPVLHLNLMAINAEGETVRTHIIAVEGQFGYDMAQLLANSAAQLLAASADFRRNHARRLANQAKQARAGLILPKGYDDGNQA
jgi:hypothetical protein